MFSGNDNDVQSFNSTSYWRGPSICVHVMHALGIGWILKKLRGGRWWGVGKIREEKQNFDYRSISLPSKALALSHSADS